MFTLICSDTLHAVMKPNRALFNLSLSFTRRLAQDIWECEEGTTQQSPGGLMCQLPQGPWPRLPTCRPLHPGVTRKVLSSNWCLPQWISSSTNSVTNKRQLYSYVGVSRILESGTADGSKSYGKGPREKSVPFVLRKFSNRRLTFLFRIQWVHHAWSQRPVLLPSVFSFHSLFAIPNLKIISWCQHRGGALLHNPPSPLDTLPCLSSRVSHNQRVFVQLLLDGVSESTILY